MTLLPLAAILGATLAPQHVASFVEVCALVEVVAPDLGLDPARMCALLWTESKGDADAVNRAGTCHGVAQVDARWASWEGVSYSAAELHDLHLGTLAGLLSARYWRQRKGEGWVACYKSGNSCAHRAGAEEVERVRALLGGEG